jgi:ATP-dependent HslUV protease ATP-binding subunit HslU
MNTNTENLGARRLHSVIEKVIADISFNAPRHKGEAIVIDREYVQERLRSEIKSTDLTKFLI